MITLFENYIDNESIKSGDFMILVYVSDTDIIYLVEVTSNELRIQNSTHVTKYYIRLLDNDKFDQYSEEIYYDKPNKYFFMKMYNRDVRYKVLFKTTNESEAINKYKEYIKLIEMTSKYNL